MWYYVLESWWSRTCVCVYIRELLCRLFKHVNICAPTPESPTELASWARPEHVHCLKVLQMIEMSIPGQQPVVDQEDGNKEPYILNSVLPLTSCMTFGNSTSLREQVYLTSGSNKFGLPQ